jgi:hypothetical protein
VAILVGFLAFMAMDKTLRIVMGGAGHDHGHAHGHEHGLGKASGVEKAGAEGVRQRKGKGKKGEKEEKEEVVKKEVKLGGLLNMMFVFPFPSFSFSLFPFLCFGCLLGPAARVRVSAPFRHHTTHHHNDTITTRFHRLQTR